MRNSKKGGIIMDEYKEIKSEYYREYYRNNIESAKKAKTKYWLNKTKKQLGKEEVTEEEIRECMNNYYREYRKNNPEKIQKVRDSFWERKKFEKETKDSK